MKVSILLPYKEDYSKENAGAVSIFVSGINKLSQYRKSTKIYGNTKYKSFLSKNYVNIPFQKRFFQSSSKIYVKNFINLERRRQSKIIEIHNRPSYLNYFSNLSERKFVIYFHNDPLTMNGSVSIKERLFILKFCDKIIFNSEWTKKRFFTNLDKFYENSEKIQVICQSTTKAKVNIFKKDKVIIFVGKLNKSKGYDIFGKAVIKILKEFTDWKALVIGDEPREKIDFNHKRLVKLGYKSNLYVLNLFKKSSIAVACSRWDEPFGRSSLEASSRGCAVIISNRGGLPETITDGVILNKLNSTNLYNELKKLIINKKLRQRIQRNSIKNFYLDNKYISSKIDNYRNNLFRLKFINNSKIKILHITNFNERHNGRLFYNTGRRINNGFVRLGHTVQTLSDRDVVSRERKFIDLSGSKALNSKLIEIVGNFNPDLIVFGHADQILNETLIKIKNYYPSIKMCQWFLDKMDDAKWSINKNRFLKKIKYLDANFCTTEPNYIKSFLGKKIKYIPNPVDESFENLNVYKNKNYKYDLFFALSHGVHRGILKKGKIDNREFFIKKLVEINNEIRFNLFGIDNKQPIWAEEFKKELEKSKMALNLSQGKPSKFYSSDRIAQLIGNGILTFVDKKTELNKIFNNKEVVFYDGVKDLSNKIMLYKESKLLRDTIAVNGMKKYHKYMNSKIVSNFIIQRTLGKSSKKKYIWEKK